MLWIWPGIQDRLSDLVLIICAMETFGLVLEKGIKVGHPALVDSFFLFLSSQWCGLHAAASAAAEQIVRTFTLSVSLCPRHPLHAEHLLCHPHFISTPQDSSSSSSVHMQLPSCTASSSACPFNTCVICVEKQSSGFPLGHYIFETHVQHGKWK